MYSRNSLNYSTMNTWKNNNMPPRSFLMCGRGILHFLKVSLTCGMDNTRLMVHATLSKTVFLFLAWLMDRGLRIAACRSRLITTVTNAHEYMATSLRNISVLHASSPASHCTVIFHPASSGMTTNVTSKSATARLVMRSRTWDRFLRLCLAE